MKLNLIKKTKQKSIKKKGLIEQRGGDVLGEGGYGCVITPPLKCKDSFYNVPYSIDKKYISKVIEYDDSDPEIYNELKLGNKLIKIDPIQKFFSPIINGCYFTKQPHKDLDYLSFKPFESDDYSDSGIDSGSNSYKKKDKCNIYGSEEYLNLISKNAGINVKEALNSREPNVINYFRKNYIIIFKHLLKGLNLLQKNNILHRDVKSLNLMIKYKKDTNKASLTYIDFGLSEELKPSHKYTLYDMYYVTGAGTYSCKPIEVVVIHYILEHMKKNRFKQTKSLKYDVLHKLITEYKDLSEEYAEKFFFGEEGFSFKNNKLDKHIKEKESQKYGNRKHIYNIFTFIMTELNENRLLVNLFDKSNYLFKWDIFSLGLIFAEIIIKANINDDIAFELVNKMIQPFYWKRYSIDECLNDPLFTQKVSTLSSKLFYKTPIQTQTQTQTFTKIKKNMVSKKSKKIQRQISTKSKKSKKIKK
jgi:serine/threonine protein kinase